MPSTLVKVLSFENSKPNNYAKEKKYNTQTDSIRVTNSRFYKKFET